MINTHQQSAAVIGAGIIGVCTAIELQRRGMRASLIEQEAPAAGASSGNCGLLAIGEVVPFSKPGAMKKIPGWLLNPEGPLVIRPQYFMKLIPWFARFLMAAKPRRVAEIGEGLAALTRQATSSYEELLASAGIKDMLLDNETLLVYDHENEFEQDRLTWKMKADLGFEFEKLSPEQLKVKEPALAEDFACAVLLKGWRSFADPKRLVDQLVAHFVAEGGELLQAQVQGFDCQNGQVKALKLAERADFVADHFVIAAGAWSGLLTRQLGDKLPVEALAGYSTTVSQPDISLQHPVIYTNGGFVVTPMEHGLRIAGTSEMGGLHNSPNFSRAKIIAKKALRLFPGLKKNQGDEWMGFRSFMPDSLPVIDKASVYNNVAYAFGHGQIGLTTGAITGKLVAQLITNETASLDMQPYSVKRF